jgi:hypothetical protein
VIALKRTQGIYVIFTHLIIIIKFLLGLLSLYFIFYLYYVFIRFKESLIRVLIGLEVLELYIHAYSLQKRQFMLIIDFMNENYS